MKSGTTEEDPGDGKIVFNNSDATLSNKLYMDSSSNVGNLTIDNFMTTLDSVTSNVKGFARLSLKNSNSTFILFQISDVVDNTGWWTVDVTLQSNSVGVQFNNDDDLVISLLTNSSKGDKGQKGDKYTRIYRIQGFTGFQGFTGYGAQDLLV